MSDDLLEQYVSAANSPPVIRCEWLRMRKTRFSTTYIRCEGAVVNIGAYDRMPQECPHCKLNINIIT